jgi:hypothetical protein
MSFDKIFANGFEASFSMIFLAFFMALHIYLSRTYRKLGFTNP